MSPKKAVPQKTDDIVELTDIVEPGVLPEEDASAASGLTDASFEDELDAMLADVPELSVSEKESAPVKEAATPDSAGDDIDLDELADLDSLLEELGDAVPGATPPPPAAGAADAELGSAPLDVDDLLAEMDAADSVKTSAATGAQAEEDDILADLDLDDSVQVSDAHEAEGEIIDAGSVNADDLLAELQAESSEEVGGEPESAEDELLAELKAVMGEGMDMPAPEEKTDFAAALSAATEESLEEPVKEPADAEAVANPAVAGTEAAAPEETDEEVPAEAPEMPEALEALAEPGPAAEAAPAAEESPEEVTPEELQHLDALLDDILQPTSAPAAAGAEAETPVAPEPPAASDAENSVEDLVVGPSHAAATAEPRLSLDQLMADDSPLRAAVQDLVRQELDTRLAVLEERLSAEVDKAAAKAAAKIIREEIAALAQEM